MKLNLYLGTSDAQRPGDVAAMSDNERQRCNGVVIVVVERQSDMNSTRVRDDSETSNDVTTSQLVDQPTDKRHQLGPIRGADRAGRVEYQRHISTIALYIHRQHTHSHYK